MTTRHQTGIEWTHVVARDGTRYKGVTWNPVTGCTRVSSGCDNCYAFTLHDQRFAANLAAAREWLALQRSSLLDRVHTPVEIVAAAREAGAYLPWPKQYDRPFSEVQLLPDRLEQPYGWGKPRAVFVDSMGDIFHEDVSELYLRRIFATMAATPRHIYMVLTKRPERMAEFVPTLARPGADHISVTDRNGRSQRAEWPLPNVWLGFSAEDQDSFEERWRAAAQTPAAVLWCSAEPLLGPIDFHDAYIHHRVDGILGQRVDRPAREAWARGLDWVVVGGESGPRYRDMDPAWARHILEQCQRASVPVFMKQVSGARSGQHFEGDLDVRQWPI